MDKLSKDNLHHAYLLLGNREEILPAVFNFVKDIGESTTNNPDFVVSDFDVFKIEDARNFKAQTSEKKFSQGRRIFIISANQFLVEAQNSLLKVFEEPKEDTHIFVISPSIQTFLPTLLSRLYTIELGSHSKTDDQTALKFIKMNLTDRINFIKDLLAIAKDEEGDESPRTVAQNFLNNLEITLHANRSKASFDASIFEHIFKVRENLRQPGAAPKMLLESIALVLG